MAKSLRPFSQAGQQQQDLFLKGLIAAPARRALANEKIDSLEKLSRYSEKEIMQLHGFGKNAMQKLKAHMRENHIYFK
ncbi:helix-hairpin-helix domain-containing protein [Chryseobacterium echinoideorum]|uniref:hypothetical protein n=1 Tax=Chryseobacterium echinoideorum TaxID=1549648 RepID=UPI001E474EF6|nr:hypothetical protein [Chryseobacterium echinoideorum]